MRAPIKPRLPKDLGPGGPHLSEKDIEREVCEYAVCHGWPSPGRKKRKRVDNESAH